MRTHLLHALAAGVCICAAAAAQDRGTPSGTTAPPVQEVGVYYRSDGQWAEILPEIVHWKTGGVLKTLATAGLVKGDVNGRLLGAHSRHSISTPEILIQTPEGVAITEYQLLRLREKKRAREFRTITGGILHVSSGAMRDLVEFEAKKIAPRTFVVVLPDVGGGEYGFLPPGMATSSHASASLGKMYSFRLAEQCAAGE